MDMVSRKLKDGSCIDVACPLAVKSYTTRTWVGLIWLTKCAKHIHAHLNQELDGICVCSGFLWIWPW